MNQRNIFSCKMTNVSQIICKMTNLSHVCIYNSTFQTPSASPEKRTNKAGTGRQSRASQLRHTGSLTYGKESQIARDNFLASIRGSKELSILCFLESHILLH